jgi:CheY-like chemotaxis protein
MGRASPKRGEFGIPMTNSEVPSSAWKRLCPGSLRKGGGVFGLVADIQLATHITQAAQRLHLEVRHFDQSEALVCCAKETPPVLVILDWDKREAEAYRLLKEFKATSELEKIPTVGVVSQPKAALREEAERAGCHRVFGKTEFSRSLDDILMRYAV